MTLPHEEVRALIYAQEFLRRLIDPRITPRIPRAVRREARCCLRHYPFVSDIRDRWSDDVCEHDNTRALCRECGAGAENERAQ